MRPRNLSVFALKDCAPKLIRFTPAARIPASFARSTVPGFASRVISASASTPQIRFAASIIEPMDLGSNSDAGPPPEMLVRMRSPVYGGVAARADGSEINALEYCSSGDDAAAGDLKSQYEIVDWHHGI